MVDLLLRMSTCLCDPLHLDRLHADVVSSLIGLFATVFPTKIKITIKASKILLLAFLTATLEVSILLFVIENTHDYLRTQYELLLL